MTRVGDDKSKPRAAIGAGGKAEMDAGFVAAAYALLFVAGDALAADGLGIRHLQQLHKFLILRSGDAHAVGGIREHASELRNLLREHIDKEDHVLYPMAERLLSEDDKATMIERFEEIERERVGAGKHEAYHEMLHRLKKSYGV